MNDHSVRLKPIIKITGVAQTTANLRKKVAQLRQEVLASLAETTDYLRSESIKEIIPNRAPQAVSVKQLYKLQKSTPGKLTSRTGRLVEMLKRHAKGGWSKGPRVWANNSSGLQVKAWVNTQGTAINEEYAATINVNAEEGAFDHSPLNKYYDQRKATKQQLFFRFKHDFGGIRGKRREFMTPVLRRLEGMGNNQAEAILAKRLKIIQGAI